MHLLPWEFLVPFTIYVLGHLNKGTNKEMFGTALIGLVLVLTYLIWKGVII